MIDHATTVYQLQQILAGSYDQNLFLLMIICIIGDEDGFDAFTRDKCPIKSTLGISGHDSIAVRITARVWDR